VLGYASCMTGPRPLELLKSIEALKAAGRYAEAERSAARCTQLFPREPQGWRWLVELRRMRNALGDAKDAAGQGLAHCPGDRILRLLLAELALQSGAVDEGLAEVRSLAPDVRQDATLLQNIAQLFTRLNLHEEAERCYRQAVRLAPTNPQYLYNLAAVEIGLGRLAEAESTLDRVIALAPGDFDAHYNRSTLKRQTRESNHVAELEALLVRAQRDPMGAVRLGYALAKEREDLGDHAESFAALQAAARARRRQLTYRVDDDERAMAEIASTFDRAFFGQTPAISAGDAGPVFVLGLPRSGTTLVDRILSAHSRVESLGEINDFATALMAYAPQARNKFELIRASAESDFAAIGKRYRETTSALAPDAAFRIDKTPINFLYVGLIAAALPEARIIHVRRKAMDVCYAMYKTLFRMAYPFSYDLGDLARYYLAYRRLMDHWRAILPGRLLEVDYEAVVAQQEAETRRMLDGCGLAFEDACLAPERNESPSLTASAAQVREKVHDRSIGLWRRYERELAPLAGALRAGGVDIERE